LEFIIDYEISRLSIQISNGNGQQIGPWFNIGIDCVEDIIARVNG